METVDLATIQLFPAVKPLAVAHGAHVIEMDQIELEPTVGDMTLNSPGGLSVAVEMAQAALGPTVGNIVVRGRVRGGSLKWTE